MSARLPCPPAPGPLEAFSVQFDPLFHTLAQRHGFRTYLAGLLMPRDRSKTLTALVGAEPLVQAQAAEVQQLQFFLSESTWNADAITARRLALLAATPESAPSASGALVIDDTGDRKDGHATDHVARQYLGSVGKIDNGIVAVTSLWADERHYYPLHVEPYTPAARLAQGKRDAAFRTKPQIALELVEKARTAGIAFEAIVADCGYGYNNELEITLRERGLPYVLARRSSATGGWAPEDLAFTFREAAQNVPENCWHVVERHFRDGHAELWWAAELTLAGHGPGKRGRAVCATSDRNTLPEISTWYLTTNLACEQVPLADIVRLYGLRNWVEQSYKQMKDELGWADFMVRKDRAIRRHWELVCCAFVFCWWHAHCRSRVSDATHQPDSVAPSSKWRKKNRLRQSDAMLDQVAARGTDLAGPGVLAGTLLERVFRRAPAS